MAEQLTLIELTLLLNMWAPVDSDVAIIYESQFLWNIQLVIDF